MNVTEDSQFSDMPTASHARALISRSFYLYFPPFTSPCSFYEVLYEVQSAAREAGKSRGRFFYPTAIRTLIVKGARSQFSPKFHATTKFLTTFCQTSFGAVYLGLSGSNPSQVERERKGERERERQRAGQVARWHARALPSLQDLVLTPYIHARCAYVGHTYIYI